MARIISIAVAVCGLTAVIMSACNAGQESAPPQAQAPAQVQPVAPPVQQAPAPQPVAATPPPTPLLPLAEEAGQPSGSASGKIPRPQGASIDAPIPGKPIEGDALIGNYDCALDAKNLPLGPFKLPPVGCKIFRAEDGSLRIGPTSKGIASIKGSIQKPTEAGFFITGGYQFPGNRLNIKARMQRKPAAQVKYVGRGRGMLNDDKSTKKEYTLTMTKK
ncbi:MAG: hypothetical protein QNJ97_23200 [Myxococcota bacterium]|nr:hypothetical protein [Myxococcota bacterium]